MRNVFFAILSIPGSTSSAMDRICIMAWSVAWSDAAASRTFLYFPFVLPFGMRAGWRTVPYGDGTDYDTRGSVRYAFASVRRHVPHRT